MSEIPFDHVNTIEFKGKEFCFTGEFKCDGGKKQCKEAVLERQGTVWRRTRKNTDYVVVGKKRSKVFVNNKHGRNNVYGRNIERAMEYKEKGTSIFIIEEEVWAKYL
jgi:hypothetical protein